MPDTYTVGFLVSGAEACAGWLVGLLLAIVGFVSVRGALPRAGYLVGAAGLALFVRWCCLFGPTALQRASDGGSDMSTLFTLSSIASMLLRVVFAGLFLAGAVVLAREIKARRGCWSSSRRAASARSTRLRDAPPSPRAASDTTSSRACTRASA